MTNKYKYSKEVRQKWCLKHYNKKFFSGKRYLVLERDNYKCRMCGMTNEEHELKWNRTISIHHLDGKGYYSKKRNNNLDNLITLCMSCHGKRDRRFRRAIIQKDSFGKVITTYISTMEASKKTGISYSAINNALRGISKTCARYTWNYI